MIGVRDEMCVDHGLGKPMDIKKDLRVFNSYDLVCVSPIMCAQSI